MPAGRPPKYKKKFAKMLIEYFKGGYKEYEKFPTKAGFSIFIDVCKDTLNAWATTVDKETEELVHPEFSVAYKRIVNFQESLLVGNSLTGEYSQTFAIFFAKCNIPGYVDKQTIDLTVTQDPSNMSDEELAAIARSKTDGKKEKE